MSLDRIPTSFGSHLRRARIKRGWTQEQLADKLKISRCQVVNIENGRGGTSMRTLVLMRRVLGCSLDWLVAGARKR